MSAPTYLSKHRPLKPGGRRPKPSGSKMFRWPSTRKGSGGISFRLAHGETKAVFGVAGSGKSTILKLALGLIKPDSAASTFWAKK